MNGHTSSAKTTTNNDTEAIRILRKVVEAEMDYADSNINHRDFKRAWDVAHAFLATLDEGGDA